jgi:hypothetical protein
MSHGLIPVYTLSLRCFLNNTDPGCRTRQHPLHFLWVASTQARNRSTKDGSFHELHISPGNSPRLPLTRRIFSYKRSIPRRHCVPSGTCLSSLPFLPTGTIVRMVIISSKTQKNNYIQGPISNTEDVPGRTSCRACSLLPVEGIFAARGKRDGYRYDNTVHAIGGCGDLFDQITTDRKEKTCREKIARRKGSKTSSRTDQTTEWQRVGNS